MFINNINIHTCEIIFIVVTKLGIFLDLIEFRILRQKLIINTQLKFNEIEVNVYIVEF